MFNIVAMIAKNRKTHYFAYVENIHNGAIVIVGILYDPHGR
jgi:hypothetical protein